MEKLFDYFPMNDEEKLTFYLDFEYLFDGKL